MPEAAGTGAATETRPVTAGAARERLNNNGKPTPQMTINASTTFCMERSIPADRTSCPRKVRKMAPTIVAKMLPRAPPATELPPTTTLATLARI